MVATVSSTWARAAIWGGACAPTSRPGWPATSKEGRIARLAARVTWQPCGSHLEALVLEARTIPRDDEVRVVTAWLAAREDRAVTIDAGGSDAGRRGPRLWRA